MFLEKFSGWILLGQSTFDSYSPLLFLPLAFISFDRKLGQLALLIVVVFSCVIQISSVCTKTHEVSVLRTEIHSRTKLDTPPQLPSTVRLFWHKLTNYSTVVPASALGFLHAKALTYQATNLFTGLTSGQSMGSSSWDFSISVLPFHGACSL